MNRMLAVSPCTNSCCLAPPNLVLKPDATIEATPLPVVPWGIEQATGGQRHFRYPGTGQVVGFGRSDVRSRSNLELVRTGGV